jgi:hypothetical protein
LFVPREAAKARSKKISVRQSEESMTFFSLKAVALSVPVSLLARVGRVRSEKGSFKELEMKMNMRMSLSGSLLIAFVFAQQLTAVFAQSAKDGAAAARREIRPLNSMVGDGA